MKKNSKDATEATSLLIEFATLTEDLHDFAKTLTDEEHRDFVDRIAINIELYATKFKAFANATGIKTE